MRTHSIPRTESLLVADMPPRVPELRVLHVDDEPAWRGGEQQMLYLAEGLARRGVPTAAVLQAGSPAAWRLGGAGVPVHELRMHGAADLASAWRIARIARAERFSVLHAHTRRAHALAVLASRFWLSGCFVIAHRRMEFPDRGWRPRLAYPPLRGGADAHVAVSNRVKAALVADGVAEWKVFVVRSVTDPARFDGPRPDRRVRARLGVPDDAFVVGNVAPLVRDKDHRTLLEACRIVRDEVPTTWVVIVGQGPLRRSILEKAESLHMEDRLVMTGFRWDVPELVRAFDVFALSSFEEGLCGALLEAAAGGCPAVATDAGGVREAVTPGETGLLVPPRSSLALAQGILDLARDPRLARDMGERARERVRTRFTPDVLTDETLAVYRRVLGREVGPNRPVGYPPS